MMLPYTIEVYFASMAAYNAGVFPAALIGLLVFVAALALVLRPPAGRADASGRIVALVLAAAWIWVGAVHQRGLMGQLDFMAPLYGIAWIAEGAGLFLMGTVLGRLRFAFIANAAAWAGLVLALLGLLGYPLAVLLLGHGWQALPVAGTAPHPTAIATAGFLLLAAAASRRIILVPLLVIPLAWGAVAAVSAHLLAFPLAYTVTASVLIALAGAIAAARRFGGDVG